MPTEQKTIRKLRAILSADVKGYSLLMADNELATIATLKSYRQKMTFLIQQHQGRVVDSPGDNILAEFASAVDAVKYAVKIQEELKERNAELSEGRKMQFRIGINIGDVVQDADRIYGDGVNVAARIEGLAEPGGICISRGVCDHVKKKLKLGFEYLGEHAVKNISEPVRVYKVLTSPEAVGRIIGERKAIPNHGRKFFFAASVMLILGIATAILWNLYFLPPPVEVASVQKMAFPLPDKLSIAVLPFVNMSEDLKQEYFSDGITEEIITALSKTPKLFVIARNSTFTYKGKPVKVQQVSEELGVQYVVEGSVRRAEDRVRITAQLIDALTGRHIWAEKYDREIKDIFAIQDEITKKIITAFQVKLTEGEDALVFGSSTNNLDAYLKALKATEYLMQFNKESMVMAQRLSEEAIALDPEYASAYRVLGVTHMHDVFLGRSKSPKASMAKAMELLQKAIVLDGAYAEAHGALGFMLALMKQYDKAVSEGELAVTLNPNSADSYAWLGMTYRFVGRWEDAIQVYKKAIRLNPIPPNWYLFGIGLAYAMTGQYEEGIRECGKAIQLAPNSQYPHMMMTIIYSLAGREVEAQTQAKELLKINPKFSVDRWMKMLKYKKQVDREKVTNALRKAGLK